MIESLTTAALHNPRPAGLGVRLAAAVYDWLLVIGLFMVVSVPIVALIGRPVGVGNLAYRALLVVVAGAFFCHSWLRGGQTPGMRTWRLRLVSNDGGPVRARQAVVRFAAAALSLAPAGAGFWWAGVDPQGRAWHDRASGTRLVRLAKRPPGKRFR